MCAGLKAARALPSRYASELCRLVGRLHAEQRARGSCDRRHTRQGRFPAQETSGRPTASRIRGRAPEGRIVRCKFRADLFAVSRRFRIGVPGRDREPRPYRAPRGLETPRTDPTVLDRRVDVGRVGGWASDARETKRAVVRHLDRAGFFAELQDCFVAQGEPRLIERVKIFKDQQPTG